MILKGQRVATLEMTQPGFCHERHSAMHVTIMANPLIAEGELGLISRYGLEYARPTTSFGAVFDDGHWIELAPNETATMASIVAISPADAESYGQFADFAAGAISALIPAFFTPPVSLGRTLAGLETTAPGRQLARMTMQSAHDVICEAFENDKVRTAMPRLVNEILLIHPEEAGRGLFAVAGIGFIDACGILPTDVEVTRITVEDACPRAR
jgi:phytoene dehydrogenase-like protein